MLAKWLAFLVWKTGGGILWLLELYNMNEERKREKVNYTMLVELVKALGIL